MTQADKSFILHTSYGYKPFWLNKINDTYGLNSYDAEELFSNAILVLAEWLEDDRSYSFRFAVQKAWDKSRKFIGVDYKEPDKEIDNEEIKSLEEIEFDFLIYQKSEGCNWYQKQQLAELVRTNKQMSAKQIINKMAYDTVVNTVSKKLLPRFKSFYGKMYKGDEDIKPADLYADFVLYVDQMTKIKVNSKFKKLIDEVWRDVHVTMTGNKEGSRMIGLHSKELNRMIVIDEETMFNQIRKNELLRVKQTK